MHFAKQYLSLTLAWPMLLLPISLLLRCLCNLCACSNRFCAAYATCACSMCCLCLLHAVTLPLFQIKKIKPLIRRNKYNLHKITNVLQWGKFMQGCTYLCTLVYQHLQCLTFSHVLPIVSSSMSKHGSRMKACMQSSDWIGFGTGLPIFMIAS